MITSTHVVVNGLVAARRGERLAEPGAFVLGGLAPDVGLYLLSAGAAAWYPLTRGWSLRTTFAHVFDDLFFNDPVWLTVQNVLHAPLVLGALYAVGRSGASRGHARLRAFALGCLVHVALDVPTHHDDGPLVLFPLDWTFRVVSPVSYWDPAHFGHVVQPVDLAITLVGGGWLLRRWSRGRLDRGSSTTSSGAIRRWRRGRTIDGR